MQKDSLLLFVTIVSHRTNITAQGLPTCTPVSSPRLEPVTQSPSLGENITEVHTLHSTGKEPTVLLCELSLNLNMCVRARA